jgi:hypothetical protein
LNFSFLQKKELETLSDNEKSALKMKISENEIAAGSYQKSADQKYSEAHMAMNPIQVNTVQTDTIKKPDNVAVLDSVKQSGNEVIKNINKQSDTGNKIASAATKPVEIFSIFEVLPKPVSDPKVKISIDPEVPAGLIYRVQMGVFRNPVSPSYFKGINPVYGFKIPGTDKTSYYAGMFRKSADAGKALATIKAKGFNDSFVVALFDSKRVSPDRSAIMEKEWGNKPLLITSNSSADTIPPTLVFKVEVTRSLKPLKDDVVEGIKKVAGNRGLDIQTLDNGNSVYLIGKFITFDSAAEYSNLMIRNGYRDARVVSFLGKKEIPVETAKKLLESPK